MVYGERSYVCPGPAPAAAGHHTSASPPTLSVSFGHLIDGTPSRCPRLPTPPYLLLLSMVWAPTPRSVVTALRLERATFCKWPDAPALKNCGSRLPVVPASFGHRLRSPAAVTTSSSAHFHSSAAPAALPAAVSASSSDATAIQQMSPLQHSAIFRNERLVVVIPPPLNADWYCICPVFILYSYCNLCTSPVFRGVSPEIFSSPSFKNAKSKCRDLSRCLKMIQQSTATHPQLRSTMPRC
jgi:hypothetical protein